MRSRDRILVVVEKPNILEVSLPYLRERYGSSPEIEFVPLFTNPFAHMADMVDHELAGPAFKLPRGRKWKDYPFVQDVRYKPRDFASETVRRFFRGHALFEWDQDEVRGSEAIQNLISTCSQHFAIAIYDDNPSSAHAVHLAFESIREGGWGIDRVHAFPITDTSLRSMRVRFGNPENWRDIRRHAIEPSNVKRYFEFNYRANAIAVLGKTFEMSKSVDDRNVDGRHLVNSKNSLQLLAEICQIDEHLTRGEWIRGMDQWKGSGKYPPNRNAFGSAASWADIFENLVRSGMVVEKGNAFVPTELAWRFFSNLHPDCRDPDQSLRLATWCKLPLDDVRPLIDRYIRSFFGKQKKFIDRRQNP